MTNTSHSNHSSNATQSSGVRGFLAGLSSLDRRWIFLGVALAVGIPILLKLSLPEVPGPMARATFNAIEKIPSGSRVLLTFDYDPASQGELQPMANALVHHCASRGHNIVFMALWPLGKQLADKTIKDVLKEFHPEYVEGTNYVQLGFKTGNEGVIKLMTTAITEQYPNDASGAALTDIPLMSGVNKLSEFKLIGTISAGYPGAKEWVQYADGASPEAFTLVAGSTGVQVSQLLPYYPKQLEGLLVAVKGAAEYEMLVTEKYPVAKNQGRLEEGRRRMGPQLVAHLLVIGLIVLGNVAMIAARGAKGGAR
jgi:hypothetical protein